MFTHEMYQDVLLTVSTVTEILILWVMIKEGPKVVENVKEIRDSTTTDFGETEDLPVGSRVFVLQPQPGLPRDQWPYSTAVWVIREADSKKNRAIATPVLPPIQGAIPTVSGPMRGPLSPFKKAHIAS
ncbi:MAG TPA: hypothetical protein VMU53_11195 [Candidatus Sulfotelmatobacter sp.]|nr:hypothetical protein [Candidatus Sulfotelmatobacter sp.]